MIYEYLRSLLSLDQGSNELTFNSFEQLTVASRPHYSHLEAMVWLVGFIQASDEARNNNLMNHHGMLTIAVQIVLLLLSSCTKSLSILHQWVVRGRAGVFLVPGYCTLVALWKFGLHHVRRRLTFNVWTPQNLRHLPRLFSQLKLGRRWANPIALSHAEKLLITYFVPVFNNN